MCNLFSWTSDSSLRSLLIRFCCGVCNFCDDECFCRLTAEKLDGVAEWRVGRVRRSAIECFSAANWARVATAADERSEKFDPPDAGSCRGSASLAPGDRATSDSRFWDEVEIVHILSEASTTSKHQELASHTAYSRWHACTQSEGSRVTSAGSATRARTPPSSRWTASRTRRTLNSTSER